MLVFLVYAETRVDIGPLKLAPEDRLSVGLRRAVDLHLDGHVGRGAGGLDGSPEAVGGSCRGCGCVRRTGASPDVARISRETQVYRRLLTSPRCRPSILRMRHSALNNKD